MSRATVDGASSPDGTKPSIAVFDPKTVAPATVEIANPNTKSSRGSGASTSITSRAASPERSRTVSRPAESRRRTAASVAAPEPTLRGRPAAGADLGCARRTASRAATFSR